MIEINELNNMNVKVVEKKLNSCDLDEDWLFGPSTFFIDSYIPSIERIYLDKKVINSETVIFKYISYVSKSLLHRPIQEKIKRAFSWYKLIDGEKEQVFIDLRVNSPSNISHAIMIHLPVTILATSIFQKEIQNKKLILILPEKIPNYIKTLFEFLGYRLLLTDKDVRGQFIQFSVKNWACFRNELMSIFSQGINNETFKSRIKEIAYEQPKKLFISRKDTRKLINEKDVEAMLSKQGYTKVYAEDYSLEQQIAMVSHADSIIAIHGAALGLLSFRGVFNLPNVKVIEIFPAAHISDVYRFLTRQLGGQWAAVRGQITSEIISYAYPPALPGAIRRHSLDNFTVCLESLQRAINLVNNKSD